MRVGVDGSPEEKLASAEEPRAVAYRPDGRAILFTDGRRVRSVSLETGEVSTILDGWTFRELDVSEDGTRLIATVKRIGFHIHAFDLRSGHRRRMASGCSASLSPRGDTFTRNGRDHRTLSLRAWSTGKTVGVVHAPEGHTFDNQFWSNHPDWLAAKTEGEREDVFIHHVPDDTAFRATFTGDCDRPDLFVESTAAPPSPARPADDRT
jgi:hypothetical protein